MDTKIQPQHLRRPAIVYIRQSTLQQVYEHRESTERQYALIERAKRLGWDASQVQVIDEDLGQSGSSTADRTGFQRMAAEVGLARVGAIISLEVSRLARSSADWHRLLDLCALSATLIVDDDGIYDPNDFNDRLVLGLKGTMSDAERHLLRLRLQGAMRHKASKGKLVFPAPTGYLFDDRGVLVMDPDEAVQEAIRLLFERFRLDGTAYGVAHYFHKNGLRFPGRLQHKDAPASIEWNTMTPTRVDSILRNPFYAGAYAYGRKPLHSVLVGDTLRRRRNYRLPTDQWSVLIRDALQGYISWEQYQANVQKLAANRAARDALIHRGAPRHGPALLQGLVICGRCGRRMQVAYPNSNQNPVYVCRAHATGGGTCWSVPMPNVDEAVVQAVLATMVPEELELSLSVVNEVERQAKVLDRQWKLRIERARYEAERAARQFHAVEPENRLVARTLEATWNEKLRGLAQVEQEYEETRQSRKLTLTDEDRRAITELARDVPRLWQAATTTMEERKRILRLLIEDLVLTPVDVPQRVTQIRVLWKTGATQEIVAPRPAREETWKTPDAVVTAIRELVEQRLTDAEVADALNARGLRSGHGRLFNRKLVSALRHAFKIQSKRTYCHNHLLPAQDERGWYSVRGLAAHYEVTEDIVRNWIHLKVIIPERQPPYRTRWIEVTPEVDARLREKIRHGYGPRGTRRRAPRRAPPPRPRAAALGHDEKED